MINETAVQIESEKAAQDFASAWQDARYSDNAFAKLEEYKNLRRMLPTVSQIDSRHVGYVRAYPLTQGYAPNA